MEVSRHCDVVGTFGDAPNGEVYVAFVWGPDHTGAPYYHGYYRSHDWSRGGNFRIAADIMPMTAGEVVRQHVAWATGGTVGAVTIY